MDNRINIEAERERVGRENAEFTEWWDREQACPEHSLITQNAAHAAWQERARRTPADAVGAGELPPLPEPEIPAYAGEPALYTAEQVEQIQREAIAHYLRKQAALQEIIDIGQASGEQKGGAA
jgi:hypothetical protein